MKKTAFLSVLSVAFVATGLTIPTVVGSSGASNEKVQSIESNAVTQTYNSSINSTEDLITPISIGNKWRETATGSNKTATSSFVVPKDYGHVKLYFLNNSAGSVTITVTHVTTGKEYIAEVVAAGKSLTWRSTTDYPQGMRSGDYTVQYRSSSVSDVSVTYSGFASNSETEANR